MVISLTTFLGAAAFAFFGSFTFWQVANWWDFYRIIILFIAGYLAMILVWWVFIDIYGRLISLKKEHKKVNKVARFLLSDAMQYIYMTAGARVTVNGADKLPKNSRFLYIQNHTSNFDPMIAYPILHKYDVAFISKPSNFKIPLAKRLMPSLFFQPINREDPIQSLHVMKNSIDLISNNVTSIGVYPEGTRHQDHILGEFHEGVFNICLKAKCPLVIATTSNVYNIHKNFPFKKTHIDFDIIDVIPYEEMENYQTAKALSDYAFGLMKEHLDKIQ